MSYGGTGCNVCACEEGVIKYNRQRYGKKSSREAAFFSEGGAR